MIIWWTNHGEINGTFKAQNDVWHYANLVYFSWMYKSFFFTCHLGSSKHRKVCSRRRPKLVLMLPPGSSAGQGSSLLMDSNISAVLDKESQLWASTKRPGGPAAAERGAAGSHARARQAAAPANIETCGKIKKIWKITKQTLYFIRFSSKVRKGTENNARRRPKWEHGAPRWVKVSRREPKGSQKGTKGSQRDPKGSQTESKIVPKWCPKCFPELFLRGVRKR